jgi:membrane protein implicated in regulation of membrane protease activity
MRYTKAALLIFGLGLVAGFVVVVGEFSEWEYLASGLIALGIVLLPAALFADGHGLAAIRWLAGVFWRRRQAKTRRKPGSQQQRRRSPPPRIPARTAAARARRRTRG